MKRYRTTFLSGTAILFLAFPVVYLVCITLWFDIPLGKIPSILLSPFFYFLSFWACLAGYGLWEMKRWAWYVFLGVHGLVLYENLSLLWTHADTHHRFLAFLVASGIQALWVYRVHQEVRVPYFLPKIRWWESAPTRLAVPTQIRRETQELVGGQVLDLSMKGCFVKTGIDFSLEEEVFTEFNLFGQRIECKGRVVWCSHSAVTHPKGIGVKFIELEKDQKEPLKMAIRRLRKLSALYKSAALPTDEEEFLDNLDRIHNREIEAADEKSEGQRDPSRKLKSNE